MCLDGSTIILPSFCVILGAHWWVWSLNRENLVSINVFGQMIHNVAISDIFAVTAIATSTLLLIVEICSWCRTAGGCDPRTGELNQLKQRRIRLNENVKILEKKVGALKKMTDRIKLLIPYDLNTMVEAEMFDHIPTVTFSPDRAVPPPSKAVTASFHMAGNPVQATQSVNHVRNVLRSPQNPQITPMSVQTQNRSNVHLTPTRNPVHVSTSNSNVQSPKATLSFSPSHHVSYPGNKNSASLLRSPRVRSPQDKARLRLQGHV